MYQLEELVICEAIDPAVLSSAENSLMERRGAGEHASAHLSLASDGSVLDAAEHAPMESFMEIAAAINRFQKRRNGLIGTISIHGTIVPYQLEPQWHAESFNDSFIATTKAATDGLSGTVPGRYWAEAAGFVLRSARQDSEFTDVPSIEVVHPPVHSLLHVPFGAFHRSPIPTNESPEEKLIINALVTPSFLRFF